MLISRMPLLAAWCHGRLSGRFHLGEPGFDKGDDAAEQQETGEYLIRVLDEDRLSNRQLLPLELAMCLARLALPSVE